MDRRSLGTFALVSLLAVAGCGGGAGSSGSPAPTTGSSSVPSDAPPSSAGSASIPHITLVLGTLGDDFYKAIECGAKLESQAKGVEFEVQAPTAFDATLQIPIVNAIAAKKPDAVIIAPNDSQALFEPLSAIVEGGAKLVLVDTNLTDTTLAAGHIGSDYVLYGEQGAQEIAASIGGKGKVLGIFAPPGVSTNDLGREGFTSAMKAFPDVKVLEFEFSSGEAGKSADIVSAILSANPDLAGVFTFNGGDAPGVVTALNEAGAAQKVKFVSGDAQPFQVEQLKNGEVQALIVQQARTMGTLSIQYALDALAGKDVPGETALPTVVAKLDNLETPDVANNLYQGC